VRFVDDEGVFPVEIGSEVFMAEHGVILISLEWRKLLERLSEIRARAVGDCDGLPREFPPSVI